jgi:hypothetical protein
MRIFNNYGYSFTYFLVVIRFAWFRCSIEELNEFFKAVICTPHQILFSVEPEPKSGRGLLGLKFRYLI